MILRGETRDAGSDCRLDADEIRFLDLPFYEKGRYRRFQPENEDRAGVAEILEEIRPDIIFATGDAGDPSSNQAICFQLFAEAFGSESAGPWRKNCNVWLYRGRDQAYEAHEIEMAVPMSPDQLGQKVGAIRKFMSTDDDDVSSPARNQEIASKYNDLGLAEYEAIEAFRKWSC